jgi:YD repeat-containing protein
MKDPRTDVVIGFLVACTLFLSCKPQPPMPASPAEPERPTEPLSFPTPPPLTADASQCVTRRFDQDRNSWAVHGYEYDAVQHTVGGVMQFDGEGSIVRWDMSDTFRTYTYDAQGNLHEEANWKHDQLVAGTRWSSRYEGDPPRLAAVELSDFRKPKERNQPHTRMRFEYDPSGRVKAVEKQWARGAEHHAYEWKGDRIVAVRRSLGPRLPGSAMPYDEGVTYEYDAQGRVRRLTVDGELPLGEGATADGKPDHVLTFSYDAEGRLERMEGDGRGGDIGPEAPDGKPDEVTLLSPPCDPIVKLAPQLFGFPELPLPNSIAPAFR